MRAKLKAASQEEQIQIWNEHFKTLLGKSPKVTDQLITKNINNQSDFKPEQFTQGGLGVILTKIKNMKRPVLMKYLQKYGRQGHSMTYCSNTAKPYITRTQ